jgi:hypothetical protein
VSHNTDLAHDLKRFGKKISENVMITKSPAQGPGFLNIGEENA